MSLPQKQNTPSHNMPQPQINNSQQRMRKLRSRKTSFQIRDQDTPNLGLLPANLPNTPLTTRANDTTESSVSIGVTVGCTLLLIMIVSLLTILFCIWHRKKSLRSKALDCTKSPWTQRYRDGARNGGLARPKMRMTRTIDSQTDVKQMQEQYHDQRCSTYTIYKDTPSLEGNDTFSKESDLDPSFQNEYRLEKQKKAENEASTFLNASTTKRRTKLPDVWCSPILPMPDSVRVSPRIRTSVFQNPHAHPDVIRGSSIKGTNSEDSSATMIGLGLMVSSDTVADYTIVDDPSPVEKTGDLWDPVKDSAHDDLICSADKYAALMPRSSILRHPQAKKTESLGVMSRSPSDTSIYTAVSLATLVMEESTIPATLSEIDDDQKTRHSEIVCKRESDVLYIKQRCPKKSKTVPSLRGERKSRTSSSRLLDEIFDEQRDARVTRTFTAAMRMMKKNLKARKPPTKPKNGNSANLDDNRPVSLRSLARRSEVRRRTKTQFDRTSALLSHSVSPYVVDIITKEAKAHFNHIKQKSNDSTESACSSLHPQDSASTTAMDFHLPSRLSTSGTKVFTLSPQKMALTIPSTPQNRHAHKTAKSLLRKKTIQTIHHDDFVSDQDARLRASVLLTAKAIHRKSRSLDSCLSSAILGYLHTPTSVKIPERSSTGPYVQPKMIGSQRERSNSEVTTTTRCNTTPLRIRKSANSPLLAKVKYKRISQLIQTNGGNLMKVQYNNNNNRESQYSMDGEYASPTMQVVALYDEYTTDDEEDDNLSTTTSEKSHFAKQFNHRRSRSRNFFLS